MKKFKSLVLIVIGLLCSVSVSAEDFEVDGIYYNITSQADNTVAVTYRGDYDYDYSDEYSGDVKIPESVTYNGKAYSVTSIGEYAFWVCSSLISVEIPNSVTSIGNSVFYGCSSLTSVTIPNSVISIGDEAFRDCINLKKLISYAEVSPICGCNVFDGVNTQECTLQVPEKSISAYQQADQWKEFSFIEGVPTAIGGVTVDGAVPATADVYSTNGMLVKRNADLKNLNHELPAGIYIIGGKKVYVR